ncbi:hypothetical protein V8C40DRAFT_5493 [Trichoderma camerunense]
MGDLPTAGDRNENGAGISPETKDTPSEGDERKGSRWLGRDNEDANQDGEELDLLEILAGAANWRSNGFQEQDTEEIPEAAICMGKSEIKGDPLEFEKPHINGPNYQVPPEILILADYQEDFLGLDMDKMGQRVNLVQFPSFKADPLPDRKPHTFRPLAVVSPEKIVSWFESSNITLGDMAGTEDQRFQIMQLCYTYRNCFVDKLEDIKTTDLV